MQRCGSEQPWNGEGSHQHRGLLGVWGRSSGHGKVGPNKPATTVPISKPKRRNCLE